MQKIRILCLSVSRRFSLPSVLSEQGRRGARGVCRPERQEQDHGLQQEPEPPGKLHILLTLPHTRSMLCLVVTGSKRRVLPPTISIFFSNLLR